MRKEKKIEILLKEEREKYYKANTKRKEIRSEKKNGKQTDNEE